MPSYIARAETSCKNCYKCIRHCPVKSIRFTGDHAHIITGDCVLCGTCYVTCPQSAKEILSEVQKVEVFLQGEEPVVISMAPSFVAYFDGVGIESIRKAVQTLGFLDAEETAVGATIVKREYERMIRESEKDIIITSCCHSVNLLIQKYFPKEVELLADVLSPMQAHCAELKKKYPTAKTVFVGPCISKKDEAQYYEGLVDAVLTFNELEEMLSGRGIELEQNRESNEESRARLFPTTGGILKTLSEQREDYTYLSIDGMDNCIRALKDIEKGDIHKCFIEMSACAGSCIGGPIMQKYHNRPLEEYMAVTNYAGPKDFTVTQPAVSDLRKHFELMTKNETMPSEVEIRDVLREMGKFKPSQELNCGTCGYDTCRDKAIAVLQGKANISMCLPMLTQKAESFSDTIVKNTPNALLVVNDLLEVQQINAPALKMMNLRKESDAIGSQLIRIMDPGNFMKVKRTGEGIYNEKTYLADYDKYVEQTIVQDRESRMLICIMKDITMDEVQREYKEKIGRETIETADQVIANQMRVVQEIASLLGETAAETKIALTKLKETIEDE